MLPAHTYRDVRPFSVAGPTVETPNLLPEDIRDAECSDDSQSQTVAENTFIFAVLAESMH